MDGMHANPKGLRLWEGHPTVDAELFGPPGDALLTSRRLEQAATCPITLAEQLFACEAIRPASDKTRAHEFANPYSLEWFQACEHYRHQRRAKWLDKLLEFHKHAGETLLGLGGGLGTDWIRYADFGASVVVCSSSATQLELIQRNFKLRGLSGRFLHGSSEHVPLLDGSMDVVCLNGLVQRVPQSTQIIDEVYRVLKPGGKVIALLPAKYSIDFWNNIRFFWKRWWRPHRRESADNKHFSARRLSQLFGQFDIHRIRKRHLLRGEVPHLWRVVPRSFLERVIGRTLILKAFKPVSTALAGQVAA